MHSGLGEAEKFRAYEHELRRMLCSPEDGTEILVTNLYCVLIEGGQPEKQCVS